MAGPTATDILSGNTKPSDLSDDQLEAMDHGSLLMMRAKFKQDMNAQDRLAPFEHQAFAREYVKENPVSGTAALLAAVPLYYAAKLLNIAPKGDGPQTAASFDQVSHGYKGIAQGLGIR